MIQYIESLRPECKLEALGKIEVLSSASIPIEVGRPVEGIQLQIAGLARLRVARAPGTAGVQPLS